MYIIEFNSLIEINEIYPLQWRLIERDSVSNHQPRDCLFNWLFSRRSKKTSKLRVTGLCAGNSPATGEFPAQMASNAENVSIWWRHHAIFQWLRARLQWPHLMHWCYWCLALSHRFDNAFCGSKHSKIVPIHSCLHSCICVNLLSYITVT